MPATRHQEDKQIWDEVSRIHAVIQNSVAMIKRHVDKHNGARSHELLDKCSNIMKEMGLDEKTTEKQKNLSHVAHVDEITLIDNMVKSMIMLKKLLEKHKNLVIEIVQFDALEMNAFDKIENDLAGLEKNIKKELPEDSDQKRQEAISSIEKKFVGATTTHLELLHKESKKQMARLSDAFQLIPKEQYLEEHIQKIFPMIEEKLRTTDPDLLKNVQGKDRTLSELLTDDLHAIHEEAQHLEQNEKMYHETIKQLMAQVNQVIKGEMMMIKSTNVPKDVVVKKIDTVITNIKNQVTNFRRRDSMFDRKTTLRTQTGTFKLLVDRIEKVENILKKDGIEFYEQVLDELKKRDKHSNELDTSNVDGILH